MKSKLYNTVGHYKQHVHVTIIKNENVNYPLVVFTPVDPWTLLSINKSSFDYANYNHYTVLHNRIR